MSPSLPVPPLRRRPGEIRPEISYMKGHPRAVRGDIMCVPRIAFLETRCSFSPLLYPKCSFMVPINRSHGVHQDAPGPIQFHEGGAEL